MEYKSEVTKKRAEKKGTLCQSCGNKNAYKKNPQLSIDISKRNSGVIVSEETKKKMSKAGKERWRKMSNDEYLKICESRKGEGNSFFGRKHSKESLEKMLENKDYTYAQTDDFKKKVARHGKDNGMFGKKVYDVWIEKYGQEKADVLLDELKEKLSKSSKGKNNAMYGKPAPTGSGNGWSGWYKEWYFRSLKELSYMINVIEKNNWDWKAAECEELTIKYLSHDGTDRTYKADFLVENKWLIEVKPMKLMNSPTNKKKKEAAIKFCENIGIEYKMVDIEGIKNEQLIELVESGEVKLLKKYEDKLKRLKN